MITKDGIEYTEFVEWLFAVSLDGCDEETGDQNEYGLWTGRLGKYLLSADQQGFRSYERYESESLAHAFFAQREREYDAWSEAGQPVEWLFDPAFAVEMSTADMREISQPGRDASAAVRDALDGERISFRMWGRFFPVNVHSPDLYAAGVFADALRDYGAWDDLGADPREDLKRVVWIAAGNIREEQESASE